MELNQYIDHTLLKATATQRDIESLCKEAKKYNFCAVCVNPCYVCTAKRELKNSSVKVCTVIGFPLGQNSTKIKYLEAKSAIKDGADEIDVVINIGAVLSQNYDYITNELVAIRKISKNKIMKVIVETCYLSTEQIEKLTQLCVQVGADYIKTSTGFGTRGTSVDDVKTMARAGKGAIKIKASGGIKTRGFAEELINAGATRIGTSSGVALVAKE